MTVLKGTEHFNQLSINNRVQGYWKSRSVDLLIKDEVRGKVEHLSICVFVGAPAEAKGGQTHPRVLDQGDLVLYGQAPEA